MAECVHAADRGLARRHCRPGINFTSGRTWAPAPARDSLRSAGPPSRMVRTTGLPSRRPPLGGRPFVPYGQTTMPSDLRWFTAATRAEPTSSHICGPQMAARLPLFGMIFRVAE